MATGACPSGAGGASTKAGGAADGGLITGASGGASTCGVGPATADAVPIAGAVSGMGNSGNASVSAALAAALANHNTATVATW